MSKLGFVLKKNSSSVCFKSPVLAIKPPTSTVALLPKMTPFWSRITTLLSAVRRPKICVGAVERVIERSTRLTAISPGS